MKNRELCKGLFGLAVVVLLLVAACGNPTPTVEAPPAVPEVSAEELQTLVVDAVMKGDADQVEQLLSAGADPMTTTNLGPLPSLAALNGNPDVLGLLAGAGADLNALDVNGMAPIHIAAAAGHMGAVGQLLDLGIDINSMGGTDLIGTPLLSAIDAGQLEMADMLILRGANVNLANGALDTPLISAVKLGNLDMANLLIDNGALLDFQGLDGLTPLHFAALNDDMEMFDLLLDSGADFSILSNDGLLPFDMGTILPELDPIELGNLFPELQEIDLDNLFPDLGNLPDLGEMPDLSDQ